MRSMDTPCTEAAATGMVAGKELVGAEGVWPATVAAAVLTNRVVGLV